MGLLEDLKMSLLNFKFAMIYAIHKMLILLKKNTWIILKIFSNIFFKKSIIDFCLFKKTTFPQHLIIENTSLEEEKLIKYTKNHLRLKKTKLHCN